MNLFVLTGAGVSAESGLKTFRDNNGLWENYRVEEVASIDAWHRDPQLVWNFYSMRRQQAGTAAPNAAHRELARAEQKLRDDFFLCTQNVDDLHEQAGSQRIAHVHGKLFETKCSGCARAPFHDPTTLTDNAELPRCHCGALLRPNICWFGEALHETDRILRALTASDTFLAIGTSGNVYPVAAFVEEFKGRRQPGRALYVGPERPLNAAFFDEVFLGPATQQLPWALASLEI
jgi:NAD-dependent deacetylase